MSSHSHRRARSQQNSQQAFVNQSSGLDPRSIKPNTPVTESGDNAIGTSRRSANAPIDTRGARTNKPSYTELLARSQADAYQRAKSQQGASDQTTPCVNSTECASGFRCKNGECVPSNAATPPSPNPATQPATGGPDTPYPGEVAGTGGCTPPVPVDPDFPISPCGQSPDIGGGCNNDNCYSSPPFGDPDNEPGSTGSDSSCGDDIVCRVNEETNVVECIPGFNPGNPDLPDVPVCEFNSDCSPGMVCASGFCVPDGTAPGGPGGPVPTTPRPIGCEEGGNECPADTSCVDGVCTPDTPIPCPCPDNHVCVDGTCIPTNLVPITPGDPGWPLTPDPPPLNTPPPPDGPPDPEYPEPEEPEPGDPGTPGDGSNPPGPEYPYPNVGLYPPDGSGGNDGLYDPYPGGGGKSGCSPYCDSYKKFWGESAENCDPLTECDECTECMMDGSDGYGRQLWSCKEVYPPRLSRPCWCEPDSCQDEEGGCAACNTNPGSDKYGECDINLGNCAVCSTVYGPCCGEEIKSKACASYALYGELANNISTRLAYRQIEEYCNAQGPCRQPECNCHDDCGDCELCNNNGSCEPDPDCVVVRAYFRPSYSMRWQTPDIFGNPVDHFVEDLGGTFFTLPGLAPFVLQKGDSYTFLIEDNSVNCPAGFEKRIHVALTYDITDSRDVLIASAGYTIGTTTPCANVIDIDEPRAPYWIEGADYVECDPFNPFHPTPCDLWDPSS